MNETFEVLQSQIMNSSSALDILTGAYVLEFDIDVDKESVRAHASDLRNLLRRHVAFQPDVYTEEGYSFSFQFSQLQGILERKGWVIYGALTLRKSAHLAYLGDTPTAVFSLVRRQRMPRSATIMYTQPMTSREQFIADKDPEHFVFWDDISATDLDAYKAALAVAHDERGIHALLKSRPVLLVQSFTAGHGRWVYGSKWLGKDHEVDFMIATKNSIGYEWTMIELEPTITKPFQPKGKPTARPNEAIDQIKTWRTWIQSNIDYARREGGSEGSVFQILHPVVIR